MSEQKENKILVLNTLIDTLTVERDAYREALENIKDLCNDEIKTRSAGLSEKKLKSLKVLSLLILPRNIAKAVLSKYPEGK